LSNLKSLLWVSNPLLNKAGKLKRTPAQLKSICSVNFIVADVPLRDASILSAALVQAFPMPVLLSVTVRLDLVWMLLFSSEDAGAIKVMRFCRMAF